MVLIRGALTWDEDRRSHKLTTVRVLPLAGARGQLARSIHMRLSTAGLQPEQLEELRAVCEANPGPCRLVFHLDSAQANRSDSIDVVSDKYMIDPGPECFDRLRDLFGAGNVWLSSKGQA
jgi:DNA polymerase-3 subunit alpha